MCVGLLFMLTHIFIVCSLNGNQIGDAGAAAIGEGLKASQTLKILA